MSNEHSDAELSNWSRHYDTLLWNSTTVFVGLLGALAAVSFQNFHWLLSVVGMSFCLLPVYFAASFRESRDIVHKSMSVDFRQKLFSTRRLKQWPAFVFIFICLESMHYYLLVSHEPERTPLWAIVYFVVAIGTTFGLRLGTLHTVVETASEEENGKADLKKRTIFSLKLQGSYKATPVQRTPTMNPALSEIHQAFAKRGHETYGEGVSQLEHALQCAHFAQRDGATPAQVLAAYLHDIGHLVHDLPSDIADQGIDTQHESLGSVWLSRFFGPEVTEPVRLHVAAKRYLAAVEAGYFDQLSDASKLSLKLQGGPMQGQELADFEAHPFFKESVALRRWDEEGKIVGFKGPTSDDFDGLIETLAKA